MRLNNAHVRFDEVALGGETVRVAVPLKPNHCWLTSLSVAVGPMAREEARRATSGPALWGVLALSHMLQVLTRLTRVDEAVYPEHQLLTTSLYHGRLPALLAHTDDLARMYPGKAIVIRSLVQPPSGTRWPFRLVWIIDDLKRDWAPRTDTRRDIKLLSDLALVPKAYGADIDDRTLGRCLALYRELYIQAYSAFNPDYRPDGMRELLAEGLEIHTLQDADGNVAAFCALYADRDTATLPMMGYDRTRPRTDGLYRAIQAHMAGIVAARGLKLNLSAGAPHFKRHRGAKPWMEYLLIVDIHLPAWRRMGYRLVARILTALEPQLRRTAGG